MFHRREHRPVIPPAKTTSNLSARHKYGLSATVHRSDGMIRATYALLGNVIYTVPDEAVADKIMTVGIRPTSTGVKISRECLNTDGTLNYTKLISYLCENSYRNNLISSWIVSEWLESKQLKIIPPKRPKKVTGTRFAAIMGLNAWNTPFKTWCEITRTYEEPFEETIYTAAGKAIEPKQAEYMKAPIDKEDSLSDKWLTCPTCGNPVTNVWSRAEYKPNYCHYCGQKFDWEEKGNEE